MVTFELVRATVYFVAVVTQLRWISCVPSPQVQVNFQLTSVSVAEGSGVFDFTLNISNAVGSTTVSLSSMSGSASLGSDFVMPSTPITSSVGDSTVSGSVSIIDDDENEDAEMFTIHIDGCTNNMISCNPGSMDTLTITIDDNDLITVTPTMTALTVQEPDQMAVIQIMTTFFPPSGVSITVTYVTTDGTATGGQDYTPVTSGSITITSSSSIPDITVVIANDTSFEDNETFFVNFTGCSPGCMIPSASDTVTVTIQSDDVGVGFQLTSISVSEGDGSVTFTLDISGPVDSTSTTVYLSTFGGTADMSDYENLTSPITSSVGATTVSGSVDIINDNIIENEETLTLHIHNCTNTAAGCTPLLQYITITITDDDTSGMGQDPHFIVPLMGNQKFCYSMQGMANFAFNLVSDHFISINAYFVLPEEEKRSRFKEYATFLGDIGILIQQDGHEGKNQLKNIIKISISASDHSVTVDGIKTVISDHSVNIVIESRSTTVVHDKTVDEKITPDLTVTVKQPKLSFKVTFVHNHIDLVFIDDSGVGHDCHGIMGQFLHKEATVSDELLEINGRLIPIEKLPAWDFVHTNDTCLHAKPKHGFQAEGILEGKYTDYIVESLFSPYFYYSKFKL